jgi:hypothetical protein
MFNLLMFPLTWKVFVLQNQRNNKEHFIYLVKSGPILVFSFKILNFDTCRHAEVDTALKKPTQSSLPGFDSRHFKGHFSLFWHLSKE